MATENNFLAPDHRYLILKADMITIKQQEQILQTEIEEIANKFRQLLESYGIGSEAGYGTTAPPSTPSITKSSGSITHVTKLEAPTFMKSEHFTLSNTIDDNCPSLLSGTTDVSLESMVNNSDGLPINDLKMYSTTALTDNNPNYIGSPHGEIDENTTYLIEQLRCLERTSPSLSRASTSCGFSKRMSSSDTYSKSTDFLDNQVVPECYDLDKEFMSRLQYYSDFTLDRQRKINLMVSHLCGSVNDSPCAVSEDILTRHVEGKESSPEKPIVLKLKVLKPKALKPVDSSSSRYQYIPTSCHQRTRNNHSQRHRYSKRGKKCSSVPLASSTMIEDSFSSLSSGHTSHRVIHPSPKRSSTLICESAYSSGSNRGSRTNGSNPKACSTMLNKTFLSSSSTGFRSSKYHSSSIPQANSTMIHDDTEPPAMVPCSANPVAISIIKHSDTQFHNDNDCNSVYTWSIYDEENGSDKDITLEELYIKKVTQSEKKTSHKPPLPPAKRCESISSRDRCDYGKLCHDYKLHKLLGEQCSETILACMSAIKSADDTCRQQNLFAESMCNETSCEIPKSNNMPRSSTRIILHGKPFDSSSMEACRASLPDLASVRTSNNNDDQSVPKWISYGNDNDKTTICECSEVPGKSNSSNENNQKTSGDSGNVDSVFTDSFNSVNSVNAPHNSLRTNIANSSGVCCSSSNDTDKHLSDSNTNTRIPQVTLLSRTYQSPVNFSKVQNIDKNEEHQESVFKVPRQTMQLKHLFRFRPNKSKKPDTKTSTQISNETKPGKYEWYSRRQLKFSSTGTANLHRGTKILDKKAVFRKFKKLSDIFIIHPDKASRIQTISNL